MIQTLITHSKNIPKNVFPAQTKIEDKICKDDISDFSCRTWLTPERRPWTKNDQIKFLVETVSSSIALVMIFWASNLQAKRLTNVITT